MLQRKQSIFSERCWLDGKLTPATVTFEDGLITGIHHKKLALAINAGDNILMPGVIDAHVHINEPGRTSWEGFETATLAALAGGVTTLTDMPLNAIPVTTNVPALTEKISSTINKLKVNCGFYGGLVPGNFKELQPLIQAGVMGIKCFLVHSGIEEFPNVEIKELEEAMPVIAASGLPLLVHCELIQKGDTDQHLFNGSYSSYVASRPKQWENKAVALMVDLCRKYKCRTHIVHVSSADALLIIDNAKKEGLPITAETCPHYMYFNEETIPDNNTLYKCAPPIRNKENNNLLKLAFTNGVLDFIASDHSPAPPYLKETASGDLMKAWGGIAGLQFLLSASWTSLKDILPIEDFIPLLTIAPARFLSLHHRKGKIVTGFDADMVVWNPEESFLVTPDQIWHRHKISPYIGERLSGVVLMTIINGKIAYDNQKPVSGKYGNVLLNKM